MQRMDLAGAWRLRWDSREITGHLPGCTYLDLLKNGLEDPFFGLNEVEARAAARRDYSYSREFTLEEGVFSRHFLELVADGLDTVCTIRINEAEVARTDNINRIWRLDVRRFCHPGSNTIELLFRNPYEVIGERQQRDPIPKPCTPMEGVGHLRKTPSHFGWDWGPELPAAGVTRGIGLESYDVRIGEIRIRQSHRENGVTVLAQAVLEGNTQNQCAGILTLTAPDGTATEYAAATEGETLAWELPVANPQLWWCNGMGPQPLYRLDFTVSRDGKVQDQARRQIGLRTLVLDTEPDAWGRQFRFVLNGVPLFIKGANWIPGDAFIPRFSRDDADFYVGAAKEANMNMLRVWGGGTFETEAFYDACDRYGILVWQDFLFACNGYPFYDGAFLENVHGEIRDQVKRLRHRASLALWCGNNEAEASMLLWKKESRILRSNRDFYHGVLRRWVEELDGVTPYWPGSPSSGAPDHKMQTMKKGQIWGDAHLWQIWHGMEPTRALGRYPTRFCSEFGLESMPSMAMVRWFHPGPEPEIFDPVMELHQKSGSGNEKMLYYLLERYREPKRFEDFVYLSQLSQSDAIAQATDAWRRKRGLTNGALFWQLNDCWPAASWSGIDYGRQKKAVMYHAAAFNSPVTVSCRQKRNRAELWAMNDLGRAVSGVICWKLETFSGGIVAQGRKPFSMEPTSAGRVLRIPDPGMGMKREVFLYAALETEEGAVMERTWLLVPEKKAALPRGRISVRVVPGEAGKAAVTLSGDVFARRVALEAEGIPVSWQDNFFDLLPGEMKTLEVILPEGVDAERFSRALRVKSLADVVPKRSPAGEWLLRMRIRLKPGNVISRLLFKLLL